MCAGISIIHDPREEVPFMPHEPKAYAPKAEEFDIAEARRVLADVFAPWVQDLGLSIGGIECAPPPGAAADWQPGAVASSADRHLWRSPTPRW
jgi:hypothetical protein